MAPLAIAAIIGAGMGLMRGMQQKKQAERDRAMEAEIARYSPWSGMSAQRPQNADVAGSVMQGGLAGASFGQQFGGNQAVSTSNPWETMNTADQGRMVGGYTQQGPAYQPGYQFYR